MIAITGAGGQLGRAVVEVCTKKGLSFRSFARTELDITKPSSVNEILNREVFDCIIHCAAYTAVDAAEDQVDQAYFVNAYAPWLLANTRIPILSVSTDYVFDGNASEPYETTSQCCPISVYGQSKRAGEISLLEGNFLGAIIRTAWVYSPREGTKNFYHTMCRLASERSEIKVVNDQTGAPTRAEDLAEALVKMYEKGVHQEKMQILHFTNTGTSTWYDFAKEIVKISGQKCTVLPIPTSAYPTKARRPKYSVLSLNSLARYGIKPRHWADALHDL